VSEPEQTTASSYFHYCLNLSGTLADIWLDENPSEVLLSVLNVAKGVLDYNNEDFNQLIVDIDEAIPQISDMFSMSLVGAHEREKVLFEARELLLERSLSSIKQSEDDRRYIQSITDRVEEIEKSSRIDHLTKIYNRQHIDKLLEDEYEEANVNRWPLSLAFIDIDDFKVINDTYGHLVGDELLKLISDFFSSNLRDTDILARYGGDEFLLMLPGSSEEVAETVLERLLKLYLDEAELDAKGIKISASVSIGIATHMDVHEFDSLKDFMAAADEALYKAKSKGKNCIRVYKKRLK
jgi:diguanylate cyclase (GGDEF)-like protein